ncbi:RNA exonuclease 1 homolog [Diretmus argenteus]
MLSPSGLFADITCPVFKRGLCERPYCWYKHDKEDKGDTEDKAMFGASYKSPIVELAGVQNNYRSAVSGPPVNDETKDDDCLQELERINKEIETVKHEVEREQRRLSHYQTAQVDSMNAVSKSEATGKHLDRHYYIDLNKPYSLARKYVVDNSKPRTDLEYDPLSNYSADLRSYSSSAKDQKAKSGQGVKRARDGACSDQKRSVVHQTKPTRAPSPELDDSKEEGVLIIDIPTSPDRKRGRAQKPCETAASEPGDTWDVNEVKPAPVLAEHPPLLPAKPDVFMGKSPPAAMAEQTKFDYKCAENTEDPSQVSVEQECESEPLSVCVFDDLSRCLDNLRSESQKIACFQAADPVVENSPDGELVSDSLHDPHQIDPAVQGRVSSFAELKLVATSFSSCQTQRSEAPAQYMVQSYSSPVRNVPSVPLYGQQMSSQMPGHMQKMAPANHASPAAYQEEVEVASGSGRCQALHGPSTSVSSLFPNGVELPPAPTKQLSVGTKEIILIESSSEPELNYSEADMSDSDPMEECYRIFMEANEEEKETAEQPNVPVEAADVEVNAKPHALAGQKRVAHVAKRAEKPVANSRPQPQVLVPLRGPSTPLSASQPSIISKLQVVQQIQQKATMLMAAMKGRQAFVSSTSQRRPDARVPPPSQNPAANKPVHSAYMNCIPVGTTMIEVGDNLHFILPEGTYPLPLSAIASPVASILTPITPGHKSSTISVFASVHSSLAAPTPPQAAVHVLAKPMPTKRKTKQRPEGAKTKVPNDVRQRYVNLFTEEFLKTTANVKEAFEKALAEERTVYNRSVNKLKYLSVAVNALKRLKNQSTAAAKGESEVSSQRAKGNIPLNLKKLTGNGHAVLYGSLKEYMLTEEMLIERNYPLQHPEKPGSAALFADNKKGITDPLKRICCRCGTMYSVSKTGKHTRKEECNYHYGKGVERKVPGGVETRYSCCEGVMGAQGCQVFKLHVHDVVSLDGFVATLPRPASDKSCAGVYSLDCEMCYTTHGLELARVTVVNGSLQIVYDTFVRPDNEVIDYNTRFSGFGEKDVKGTSVSIREVQETLLSFISTDTILIGHGLETDLCALKLLHGTVVDTSVVFPHRLGPPHTLTLNNLTADYLRRIIQESVCGRDTAEDAAACMELMLWKIKEDGKFKKW